MNHIVRRLTGLLMCCLLLLSMLPAASLAAAPALTDLAADRQSDTTGLVSFTSDVGGKLLHEVHGGRRNGLGPMDRQRQPAGGSKSTYTGGADLQGKGYLYPDQHQR